ncbi:CLUMA_CG004765, isoform A [Clunio marinus]|uniref:CLUMA_CG004765, isoform A n=1 Tax=Clunio marinus TaxID=568069 RepID=A0A1J1HSV0_9DIPT|nr:CLUMA_CG004765, isoform A [Clunio marinus]
MSSEEMKKHVSEKIPEKDETKYNALEIQLDAEQAYKEIPMSSLEVLRITPTPPPTDDAGDTFAERDEKTKKQFGSQFNF